MIEVIGKTWKSSNGTGAIRKRKNGFLFLDENKEPFLFLVDNKHNEQFFVSARKEGGRTRFMFSTMEADEKKAGFDGLGYRQVKELETNLAEALRKEWDV